MCFRQRTEAAQIAVVMRGDRRDKVRADPTAASVCGRVYRWFVSGGMDGE